MHATRRGVARVRGAKAAVVAGQRGVHADLPNTTHVSGAGALVVAVRVRDALRLRHVRIGLAPRGLAELPRSTDVAVLVRETVAIVVRVIANFFRAGVHGRIALEAVRRRGVLIETVAVEIAQVARHRVEHAVTIAILVAGVAQTVLVCVRLRRVHHHRTVVRGVEHVVVVVVEVAGVAHGVAVQILLAGVGHERTVVRGVEHVVVVVVGVHAVGLRIAVSVQEAFVSTARAAVVDAIAELHVAVPTSRVQRSAVRRVRVQVTVVVSVTGIAPRHEVRRAVRVAVGVELIRVRHERTVVRRVEHVVAVLVILAGVANPVTVGIGLVSVDHERALVRGVEHAVVVVVEVAGVASVRGAVGVELVLVVVERTVVGGVGDLVPVVIGIADVANAVPVRVGLDQAGLAHEPDADRRAGPSLLVGRDRDGSPVREQGGRFGRTREALGLQGTARAGHDLLRRRVGETWTVVVTIRISVPVEVRQTDVDDGGHAAPDAAAGRAAGDHQIAGHEHREPGAQLHAQIEHVCHFFLNPSHCPLMCCPRRAFPTSGTVRVWTLPRTAVKAIYYNCTHRRRGNYTQNFVTYLDCKKQRGFSPLIRTMICK